MTDIVNGILLREGYVLMARRTASRRNYPNTWSFPGGHVEPGETLLMALRRELLEEIGVSIVSATHQHSCNAEASEQRSTVKFHFFVIREWDREPQNLGTEHSALRWVNLKDAAQMPDLALNAYFDLFAALHPD